MKFALNLIFELIALKDTHLDILKFKAKQGKS